MEYLKNRVDSAFIFKYIQSVKVIGLLPERYNRANPGKLKHFHGLALFFVIRIRRKGYDDISKRIFMGRCNSRFSI